MNATKSMKIVCISDNHNNIIGVPSGDVILHAGDATGRGSLPEVTKFAQWYGSLPFEYKIFVAGNHDFLFQDEPAIARQILKDNDIIYLEDEFVMVNGLKVYGTPHQPEFCNWAFNLERGEQLAEKWAMIPDDTDILITHSPPYGILDGAPDTDWIKTQKQYDEYIRDVSIGKIKPTTKPVGCEELLIRVKQIKPRLHIFGHIHEGYGMEIIDETIFKNVAICTARYQPTNIPQVVIVSGQQYSTSR